MVRTNIIVNVALCRTIKLIYTFQQTSYGSHMDPLNIPGEDAHQNEVYIYLSRYVQQLGVVIGHDKS